jgi:hypothetical protein
VQCAVAVAVGALEDPDAIARRTVDVALDVAAVDSAALPRPGNVPGAWLVHASGPLSGALRAAPHRTLAERLQGGSPRSCHAARRTRPPSACAAPSPTRGSA